MKYVRNIDAYISLRYSENREDFPMVIYSEIC